MKREEIKNQFKDIRKWYAEAVARTAEWKRTQADMEALERIDELERLALRATDPDMVMVPRNPKSRTQYKGGDALVSFDSSHSTGDYRQHFAWRVWEAMLADIQENQP